MTPLPPAPNPRNLILSLLSASAGDVLTARDAVRACAFFAIQENAARVALVRLSSAGLLVPAGRGSYRLGPSAATLAANVAAWRYVEREVRAWNGGWVAVYVADLGRADRVALRARERALRLVRVRELSRGLYVRPDNLAGGVAAVRERLTELGLGGAALVFGATELDEARERAARALWDGRALTKAYAAARRRLDEWLARLDAGAFTPDVAARESFLLGHDAIRQLVFDPLLPSPLVDADERRAFVKSLIRFDHAGHVIWRDLHRSDASVARSHERRAAP